MDCVISFLKSHMHNETNEITNIAYKIGIRNSHIT